MNKIDIINVSVLGNSVYGHISRLNNFHNKGILILKSLELNNYFMVINSIGIICESCQKTSHIVVVCRIMGIPVVQVKSIDCIDAKNTYAYIDFQCAQVQYFNYEFQVKNKPIRYNYTYPYLLHQLSIVNSSELINKINSFDNTDVEQIFLRSELLWLSLQANPYNFIDQFGLDSTIQKIYEQLLRLYLNIKKNQILNFRGLDLRSDQELFESDSQLSEPNPHLGLHGTRQLLLAENYLVAELSAIDRLYAKGYTRIVYSLPFVTNSDEVNSVIKIRNKYCTNKIKIGVFIETPAAVSEIEYITTDDIQYLYVGTKDLAQLILGVDRDNSKVAHLMDLTSMPVIQALRYVVKHCECKNIPVYVFSMPMDISKLLEKIPNINRISIPAADYFRHEEAYAFYDNIRITHKIT